MRRRDPYKDLPQPPPLQGIPATEVLPALRDADVTPTRVQPLPFLRDAMRPAGNRLPASALDLPLWRKSYEPVVLKPAPPVNPVEQTGIERVAEHIMAAQHAKDFRVLLDELRSVFRSEARDQSQVYLEEEREAHACLTELDAWAVRSGFTTAAARFIGRRIALGEISPADALAELHALG